jgi:hypothetical protein
VHQEARGCDRGTLHGTRRRDARPRLRRPRPDGVCTRSRQGPGELRLERRRCSLQSPRAAASGARADRPARRAASRGRDGRAVPVVDGGREPYPPRRPDPRLRRPADRDGRGRRE